MVWKTREQLLAEGIMPAQGSLLYNQAYRELGGQDLGWADPRMDEQNPVASGLTPEQELAWKGPEYLNRVEQMPIFDKMNAIEPYVEQYKQEFAGANKFQEQRPNFGDPAFLGQSISGGQGGVGGQTGSVFDPNQQQQKFYDFLEKQAYAPTQTPSDARLLTEETINRNLAGNASIMGSVRGVMNPEMMRREAIKQQALIRQGGAGTQDILAAQEATTNRDMDTKEYQQFLSALEANRTALGKEQEMRRDIAVSNAQELNKANIAAGMTALDRQKIENQAQLASDQQTGRWGAAAAGAVLQGAAYNASQMPTPTVDSAGAQDIVGSAMTVKGVGAKDMNRTPASMVNVPTSGNISPDYASGKKVDSRSGFERYSDFVNVGPKSSNDIDLRPLGAGINSVKNEMMKDMFSSSNLPQNQNTAQSGISTKAMSDYLPSTPTYAPAAPSVPTAGQIQATPGVASIQEAQKPFSSVTPEGNPLISATTRQQVEAPYIANDAKYKPFVDPNIINPAAFLPSQSQGRFIENLGGRIYGNQKMPSVSRAMVEQSMKQNAAEMSGSMRESKGGISPFLLAKAAGAEAAKLGQKTVGIGATLAEQEAGQAKARTLAEQQQYMSALEANRSAMMNYQRMRTDIMTGNTSEANKANIAAAAAETERLRMEQAADQAASEQTARYGQAALQLGLAAYTGGATAPAAASSIYSAFR